MTYSLEQINDILGGEVEGSTNNSISAPSSINDASINNISFIGSKKYISQWDTTQASIVVVNSNLKLSKRDNKAVISVKNADLAMNKILDLFNPGYPILESDIHPNATVDESASIGEGSKIGAGSYIGKNVSIGNGVTIYPNVTIMDNSSIGDNTVIWSGTVIRERSIIGAHCIFHNNVSIGADGFGYRPAEDGRGLVKVIHIGNVVIGNHVEIGANSCVDRAKFNSTIIGDGCKIDNLVQIAHNCILGRMCIMAGSSGLAGSVTLGDGVVIGGSASIKDHTIIESGAVVGAGSGVMNNVKAGQTVLGYPAADSRETLKQWVALRRLAK